LRAGTKNINIENSKRKRSALGGTIFAKVGERNLETIHISSICSKQEIDRIITSPLGSSKQKVDTVRLQEREHFFYPIFFPYNKIAKIYVEIHKTEQPLQFTKNLN